jgi:5-methylcytosine-specific restriction endonuclease McrA
MREAIKEETIAYKKNQIILQCNICKSDSELYKNYHVDHAFPSFRTLKNDFLNLTSSIIPQTFGSCYKYYTTIFKDDDIAFRNEWVNYHNKHFTFQILCRSCNLKKH